MTWRTRACWLAMSTAVTAVSAQDSPRNRMGDETSPYLLSHRDHPVHWQPWGEQAFARAAREGKPVFLSIGYSACHWCHVMAKESFADPTIAALLNESFVCIKVDREERPDVDELYMAAVQAMGQPGGWPLSVWMTPEQRPFFGGTYFPPADKHGRPGFQRVLEHLAKAWREDRAELEKGAKELSEHLAAALAPTPPPGEPTAALLARVLGDAELGFDAQYGGFGTPPAFAPKFPSSNELGALLRLREPRAVAMATASLRAMVDGGICDQLGGGFHRYATDRAWRVPHFEKMLYDNALLATVYADAFVRTQDGEWLRAATETLNYLLREMQGEHGGFFATQDAQSEGVEGKFFLWSKAEFDALLGDAAAEAATWFGVTADGNLDGTNVLRRAVPATGAAAERLETARRRLLAARATRVRPATDDKVITAWNGLAIAAMARGYEVSGDRGYLVAAQRAATFALRELVHEGRAKRSWRAGKAPLPGVLEDQAALAGALLTLFEADGEPRWLAAARQLLDVLVRDFGDERGHVYLTAVDAPAAIARSTAASESSVPSGAALAALALLRGGLLLGDERLYDRGVAVLSANHGLLEQAPFAFASLLQALQFHVGEPREVVIAGAPDDSRTAALVAAARAAIPAPQVVVVVHDGNRQALEQLSPLFVGKVPIGGVPAAYVCRRGVCAAPTTEPQELAK